MPKSQGKSSATWYTVAAGTVALVGLGLSALYMQYRNSEQTKEARNKRKKEKKAILTEEVDDSNDEGEHVAAEHVAAEHVGVKDTNETDSNQRGEGEVGVKDKKTNETEAIIENIVEKKIAEELRNNELSKEGLLKILKETVAGMTGVIQELSLGNDQMQQPGEGPDATAARFKELYEKRINTIREEIFKNSKTSQEQYTKALQVYMNDEEVKKVYIQIERINKALDCTPLTENELSKIPESFTIDRLIEMMREIQEKTTDAQRQFMIESRQNPNPNVNVNLQYQEKLMQLQKGIFAKYHVTEEIITLAMQKYGNEPQLQTAMMKMQQEQQAAMMKMSYDAR